MAQTLQRSLFDEPLNYGLSRPVSKTTPPPKFGNHEVEQKLGRILVAFQNGQSANQCALELSQDERIPYYLAGLMLLGRAFPVKNVKE